MSKENVIEWLNGDSTVTVTLAQVKLINKVKAMAEHDDAVKIVAENSDGTLCAHLPLKYIKLSAPRKMTDEQKNVLRERLSHARAL